MTGLGSIALVIVGAHFPTTRAALRRAEIAVCQPGERLELRRERRDRSGGWKIGVYSPRGVQIGYVLPGQIEWSAGMLSTARAIFQGADTFGAVARVTFDGSAPMLPRPKPKPERREPPRPPADEYCDIFPARQRQSAASSPPLSHFPT